MAAVKTAIIGASGYSGEELLRILARHPGCELIHVTSRQYDGQRVADVFPRFDRDDLTFSKPDVDVIIGDCDVAFLALPHGHAAEYAAPLVKAGVAVIDISADFRLKDLDAYKRYYKSDHPAPEFIDQAVYGLPERYRGEIKNANLIACAGCYPTSVILPTAPLLEDKLASPEGIVVASMSGVTGAGRKVDLPFIFPECNESVRAYSPIGHRHLPEMEQELAKTAGVERLAINFVPHLVPVNRGINSTIFLDAADGCSPEKLRSAFEERYQAEPFVRLCPDGRLSDTKNVTFSNVCEIAWTLDDHTGKVILTSVIDNLTKGASGQAVQCMNIRFGLNETAGLL